jgi:hypothetical protein
MFLRSSSLTEVYDTFNAVSFDNSGLWIHCPVLESETIIKLLRNLKDMPCLDLSSSTGVDGCVFKALPELSKLTALNVSYTSVSDEDLKNLHLSLM